MLSANIGGRGSQMLSLREREIEYMIQNAFRRRSVHEVWNSQNFAAESAADGFDADRTRKVPALVEIKAFCSEASVVGLRYAANVSASPFRRSVWILLLLAGAAFTVFQIQDRIRYYWSFPVGFNLRVEHKKEMRFPTVTICNENRFSLITANAIGNSLYQYYTS